MRNKEWPIENSVEARYVLQDGTVCLDPELYEKNRHVQKMSDLRSVVALDPRLRTEEDWALIHEAKDNVGMLIFSAKNNILQPLVHKTNKSKTED